VPLAFATVASATTVVPLFDTAYGPITSLTPTGLTSANGALTSAD
jgi:hypothetical protein